MNLENIVHFKKVLGISRKSNWGKRKLKEKILYVSPHFIQEYQLCAQSNRASFHTDSVNSDNSLILFNYILL